MKNGVFILFFLVCEVFSQNLEPIRCEPYTTSLSSENPYNDSWDWNAGDTLFNGVPYYWIFTQSIPNAVKEYSVVAPWYQDAAWAGLNDRKREDGWVLLCRNFGTPTRRLDEYEDPYFVLYNYPRSVIRVFVFIRHLPTIYSYSTMELHNYNNGGPASGVLAHLSPVSFAMDRIANSYNNVSSNLINTLSKSSRWVYADFPLALDTSLTGTNISDLPASLQVNVYGTTINEVAIETKGFSAQGNRRDVLNFMIRNGFNAPGFSLNKSKLLMEGIDVSFSDVDINTTAPNWDGLKQYFSGVKVDFGFGEIDVSNPFKSFADNISNRLTELMSSSPIKISGINFDGMFKYFVGGGTKQSNAVHTAPSFIGSHYSSTGTITSKVRYGVVTFPIPGARSNFSSPTLGSPVGLVRNEPPGILALTKTPKVNKRLLMRTIKSSNQNEVYGFYYEFEIADKIEFKINPSSKLKLISLEAALVTNYSRASENGSWLFDRINSANQKYLLRFDGPAGAGSAMISSMSVPMQHFKGRKLYQSNIINPNPLIRVKAILQRTDELNAIPIVFISHFDTEVADLGIFNINYDILNMPTIPPQNVKCIVPATGGVRISWDRNLENNIASYFVERSINGGSYFVIGSTKDTLVVDNEVQKSVKPYLSNRQNVAVNYRVRAKSEWIDDDSTKKFQYSDYSDVISISGSIIALLGKFGLEQVTPGSHSLSHNFPNPFNPSTTIYYGIKENTEVSIKVFNALGQEVATLVNGPKEAGYHYAEWNAAGMPSGMYFYRIQAGDFTETKKMTLMK